MPLHIEKKLVKYDVVRGSEYEFKKKCQEMVDKCWEPIGGISVHLNAYESEIFSQAFGLYETKTTNTGPM